MNYVAIVFTDIPFYGIRKFEIGSDFCLTRVTSPLIERIYIICDEIQGQLSFPIPTRVWKKNGVEMSSTVPHMNTMATFSKNFSTATNSTLFIPGVIDPPPIELFSKFIVLNNVNGHYITLTNQSLAPGIESIAEGAVFDQMLGTYTCSLENEYGSDSATTVITECPGKTTSIVKPFAY